MPQYLVVDRKGYHARRGRKRYYVPRTRYRTADRGAYGRGEKVVPPLKAGSLGGQGFFSRPLSAQKKVLRSRVRQLGEKMVVGKLLAVAVLTKRTKPSLSRKAKRLARWVAVSSRRRKTVRSRRR